MSRPTILSLGINPDLQLLLGPEEAAQRPRVICETDTDAGVEELRQGQVDCIVSEYTATDRTSLRFLNTVRGIDTDLPFVFYTAHESAEAIQQATDAGATAYYVETEDPERRSEIRASIQEQALWYHHQLSSTPRPDDFIRLSELLDSSFAAHDLQTGRNVQIGGLAELGYDFSEMSWSIEEIFELIHPGDQQAVRQKHQGILARDESAFDMLTAEYGKFSEVVRIRRADGTYAHCLMRGILIFDQGVPAVMFNTLSDMTSVVENEWNERTETILFSTPSIQTAAKDACQVLCSEQDCRAAWVVSTAVDATHSGLTVLAKCGDENKYTPSDQTANLSDPVTERAISGTAAPDDPDQTAADRLSVITSTVDDDQFHSVSAVPLINDGVLYGALAVLRSTPPTRVFTQGLLSLGESLAFRHKIENQQTALTADVVTRLALSFDSEHVLSEISADPALKQAEIICYSCKSSNGGDTSYIIAPEKRDVTATRLAAVASAVDGVTSTKVIAGDGANSSVLIKTSDRTAETVLRAHASVTRQIRAQDGKTVISVDFSKRTDVSEVLDEIRSIPLPVRIRSKTTRQAPRTTPLEATLLTEKQREALRVATLSGFFDRPQAATAEDVADVLNVSRTTALRHIRLAENKLFTELYE
jgi:predicted DNA binding protein